MLPTGSAYKHFLVWLKMSVNYVTYVANVPPKGNSGLLGESPEFVLTRSSVLDRLFVPLRLTSSFAAVMKSTSTRGCVTFDLYDCFSDENSLI